MKERKELEVGIILAAVGLISSMFLGWASWVSLKLINHGEILSSVLTSLSDVDTKVNSIYLNENNLSRQPTTNPEAINVTNK